MSEFISRFGKTALICSELIIPGLKILGGCDERSTTVDSMPTALGPASMSKGTFPSNVCNTWAAIVGETWFARFALGAARGNPQRRITSCMKGCDGQRIPTVGPPAVTIEGSLSDFGSTKVSGPGQ